MRKARKTLIAVFAVIALVAGAAAVVVWRNPPERWMVGFHQRAITRSLAEWAPEVANITNEDSAIHAAEMVAYMSSHYVPGGGYRGPPKVEAALEAQRRESIALVVASLERYTGLDYGTNVERWAERAEQRKSSAANKLSDSSEPISN